MKSSTYRRGFAVSANQSSRNGISILRAATFYLPPTTRIEQILVFLTCILIPLEEQFPAIAGFSIIWIMFAGLGIYVTFKRSGIVKLIWLHPLFISLYVFVATGILIETMHSNSDYSDIVRIAQMGIGALFVSTLCRDRRIMWWAMAGLLACGIWISVITAVSSYGIISGAHVGDFQEATIVRMEAKDSSALDINLNRVGNTAALGVVVALVLALTFMKPFRRYVSWLGVAICILGIATSISRTAVANVVLSIAAVLFASGLKKSRAILAVALFLAISAVLVPQAVWQRMTFSTETEEGAMEGRARVYAASVEYLPEYIVGGVGAGNFWGEWGKQSDFGNGIAVTGTHNGFFQATIYWGLAGFLSLLFVIWQAYKCLPKHEGTDPLVLIIVGVSVSLFLVLMAQHTLYSKEFAIGLGLLVAGHCWIWPNGRTISNRTPRVRRT